MIGRSKETRQWIARNQAELADVCGVSVDTVHAWRKKGLPGVSGRYDLREILLWLRNTGPWRPRDETAGPVTAQDRRREFQAQLEELRLRKELGELIPREHVHETYQKLADSLRNAGDVLQRVYGEAALEILNDALERARGAIHERFAVGASVDGASER